MTKARITPAQYRATVRKLHSTYKALSQTLDGTRGYAGDELARTMDSLRAVPDLMRIQVCTDCTATGFIDDPDRPGVSTSCNHPKVLHYDVRTGEAVHWTEVYEGRR